MVAANLILQEKVVESGGFSGDWVGALLLELDRAGSAMVGVNSPSESVVGCLLDPAGPVRVRCSVRL